MITREKFKAFLKVQIGGKTNMYDVNAVCRLSGMVLSKEDCIDIMTDDNYSKYEKEFGLSTDDFSKSERYAATDEDDGDY